MSELNEEIARWRNHLAQSQTLDKSDMDELESHLREEIEHLAALGLSEQEAFWVARHRLGDTASLSREFAKVNAGPILCKRLFWMAAGVLGYVLVTQFADTVSKGCVLLAGVTGLRGYSLGLLGVVSKTLILGTTLLLLYQSYKQDSNSPRLGNLVSSPKGKVMLFTALAVLVIILTVAQLFFPAATARTMGFKEYGQMAIVSAYVRLIWPVLLPVVLMIALIKLRASKLHVGDSVVA